MGKRDAVRRHWYRAACVEQDCLAIASRCPSRAAAGTLKVVGAHYDPDTGKVDFFDQP